MKANIHPIYLAAHALLDAYLWFNEDNEAGIKGTAGLFRVVGLLHRACFRLAVCGFDDTPLLCVLREIMLWYVDENDAVGLKAIDAAIHDARKFYLEKF